MASNGGVVLVAEQSHSPQLRVKGRAGGVRGVASLVSFSDANSPKSKPQQRQHNAHGAAVASHSSTSISVSRKTSPRYSNRSEWDRDGHSAPPRVAMARSRTMADMNDVHDGGPADELEAVSRNDSTVAHAVHKLFRLLDLGEESKLTIDEIQFFILVLAMVEEEPISLHWIELCRVVAEFMHNLQTDYESTKTAASPRAKAGCISLCELQHYFVRHEVPLTVVMTLTSMVHHLLTQLEMDSRLKPLQTVWVDSLRTTLAAAGSTMQSHSSRLVLHRLYSFLLLDEDCLRLRTQIGILYLSNHLADADGGREAVVVDLAFKLFHVFAAKYGYSPVVSPPDSRDPVLSLITNALHRYCRVGDDILATARSVHRMYHQTSAAAPPASPPASIASAHVNLTTPAPLSSPSSSSSRNKFDPTVAPTAAPNRPNNTTNNNRFVEPVSSLPPAPPASSVRHHARQSSLSLTAVLAQSSSNEILEAAVSSLTNDSIAALRAAVAAADPGRVNPAWGCMSQL